MNKDAKNDQHKHKIPLMRPWVGLNHQPSGKRASQLRQRGLGASLALYICVLSENNTFLTDFGGGKFIYSPRIFLSFHSVVDITSVSHAESPQLDPGWKHLNTLEYFRKI